MTVANKSGTTVNQCYIKSELYFNETGITWQTSAISMRIRVWFVTSSWVTDTTNSLSITGSHSGSATSPLKINYQTGTFLLYDKTVTVSLTSSPQTYSINSTLSGVEYSGTLTTGTNSITIPAKPDPVSQVTYSSNPITTGSTLTMTTNRQNSSFTHKWFYQNSAGSWVQIGTGITTSATYAITAAEFAPQMTNTASRVFEFSVQTWDGAEYVGYDNHNITINLASTVVPTISTVTAVEAVADVNTKVGKLVKSLSKITATVNGAAGVYGSTITKTEVLINGVTYNGSPITTDFLNTSGDIVVQGRVTDSRGRVGTKDLTVNVLDYTNPTISTFVVLRADSSGNLVVTGTYGKATSGGSVASLINVTEKNTLTYTLSSRQKGSPTWNVVKSATTIAGLTLNATDTVGAGAYSAVNAYEFQLTVADKFRTTLTVYTMPVAAVTLSLNKTGIGVGKVWQRGAIDAAGRIYDLTGLLMPVGAVLQYGGTTDPDGFLIADGRAVSRSVYSDLFAVYSTTYGAGDGTTTFNIPNIKGKVVTGYDSTQTEFNLLGKTGGAKAHYHTLTDGYAYFRMANSQSNVMNKLKVVNSTFDQQGFLTGAVTSGTYNSSNVTALGGSTDDGSSLGPYITMNYIIKY